MRVLLGLVVVCLAVSATAAAQLVTFEDGRALRVDNFSFEDGQARLKLESGGEIRVPAGLVAAVGPAAQTPDAPNPEPEADPLPVGEVTALAARLRDESTWRRAAGRWADLLAEAADRHGLDRALLAAVAKVESNFEPFAVSSKGACGILQLMPATARRFGVKNLFDPRQNLEGGASYLRWLIDRYAGRVDLALAGYNAGEGAVDRHGGVPPFAETRSYVTRVLDRAGVAPPRP